MPPSSRARKGARAPWPLVAAMAVFVALLGALVAASAVRPNHPVFDVSPLRSTPVTAPVANDTITVDARDANRWTYVDFDVRSALPPGDTAGWDLAVRRFQIISAGSAVDAGAVPFATVSTPPDTGWTATTIAADTVNPAIDRWYRYGFLSHLLTSERHVYGVRTRPAGFATFRVLSYYCPGLVAGCVTLEYSYDPEPLAPR